MNNKKISSNVGATINESRLEDRKEVNMTSTQINQFIKDNYQLSYSDLTKRTGIAEDAVRKRYRKLNLPPKRVNKQNTELSPEQELERDLRLGHITADKRKTDKKYKLLQRQNEELQSQVDLIKQTREITTYHLNVRNTTSGAATAVVLASDFHHEELVRADSVSGLNEFNLEIAEERIQMFFVNVAKLVQLKQEAIKLDTLVLALLGDFITGAIHDEIETLLDPAEAVVNIQNHLASGIEYLLANTNVSIDIPCHSGNHGRQTKTIHQGNEHGNSHEYLMYHMLANHFRGNKRVKFLIAKGYHSYYDINGFKIRFHHGHNIKYNGGVGGVYISVNKAINQWNKANFADLDCFAHFHQLRYGGNFVLNGSLIGYNAYALSIKADYEKPKQAFFLVNHGRKEITDFSPVWLD